MTKVEVEKNEWFSGLTRLRELGAPVPGDCEVGSTFTHADSNGKNGREIGGWWLELGGAQGTEFVTWLLPGAEIDSAALSDKERYFANFAAIRQTIDQITIVRTGYLIDATKSNDKLRALRLSLQKKRSR